MKAKYSALARKEYRYLFNNEELVDAWNSWMKARDKKKAANSERAINRWLKFLHKTSECNGDFEMLCVVLDYSSDGGLKGTYTKLYRWSEISNQYKVAVGYVQKKAVSNGSLRKPAWE